MNQFTTRQMFALGFLGCIFAMAFVVAYIQHYLGLEPCPLCVAQRVAMIATAVVFLAGAIHGPRGRIAWLYSGTVVLTAGAGIVLAGRHVWLQGLPPDQVPACGPTLEYLMQMLPILEVVRTLLRGDGNCAIIDWTFLGFSLPWWSLFGFSALALYALAVPILARREIERSGTP
jgi:protein dithiol:quinone oxidoreductase